MENAYRPEAWHDLYVMLGGSAAALTGLFFVAMSIHLNEIVRAPFLRIFARNNTIAMMESVIKAAVILIPQDRVLLAAELFVIHVFGVTMVLTVLFRDGRDAPRARKLRAAAIGVTSLLGIAGAVSLAIQWGGGMYVVTAVYLIFLCLVTSSAWTLMAGVYQADHRPGA